MARLFIRLFGYHMIHVLQMVYVSIIASANISQNKYSPGWI